MRVNLVCSALGSRVARNSDLAQGLYNLWVRLWEVGMGLALLQAAICNLLPAGCCAVYTSIIDVAAWLVILNVTGTIPLARSAVCRLVCSD